MTTTELPRVRRKRSAYHHGTLRRSLLDAARLLVQRRGPAAWTMAEAARLAGVTSGAPYHHFPDRGALVQALAQEGFEKLELSLAAARAAAGAEPLAQLEALGAALLRFAVDEPAYYRVMYGPESFARPEPAVHAAAMGAFGHALEVVAEAQARAQIRPGDPSEIALLCWSTMHGLADLALNRRLGDAGFDASRPGELGARLRMLVYAGLRPA